MVSPGEREQKNRMGSYKRQGKGLAPPFSASHPLTQKRELKRTLLGNDTLCDAMKQKNCSMNKGDLRFSSAVAPIEDGP